jgi:hypothetical protein
MRRFGLKISWCEATRRQMQESTNQIWASRGQHWIPAKVIAEIRRVHRDGGSLRLTTAPIRLIRAGEKLFGSWKAAVEKAGLSYDDLLLLHRWNREKIIARILQLAAEGVPLDATFIRKHYSYLFCAAVVYFPSSWGNALRAAGFNPAEHKKCRGDWDRRKAEHWLREAIRRKRSIRAGDIPRGLKNFAQYHITGGWSGFVESLRIPYPGKRRHRSWSRATVLDEIRRHHAAGSLAKASVMKRVDSQLTKEAWKYFPTWDAAVVAALR